MKTIFPNYDFPIKNYASSAKHKPTYGSSGVGQYRGEIASSIITPTKRSALTKPTFKINVEYLRIRLGVGAPAGRGGFIRYASIALFLLSNILHLTSTTAQAQNNVGIGTTTPNPKAVLELQATDKGLLTPRMTHVQMLSIPTPPNGLLVYNTTKNCFYYFDNVTNTWKDMCSIGATGKDTLVLNLVQIDSLFAHFIKTDTLLSNTIITQFLKADSAYIKFLTSQYIKTDSIKAGFGRFDSIYVNGQNLTNYLNTLISKKDTVVIKYLRTDSIYSILIKADSAFIKSILTNTLTATYITTDSIKASFGRFDSMYVGGQNILKTINDSIASQAWLLKGNNITATNKLGTLNGQNLHIITNNTERISIMSVTGNVGIGQTLPSAKLDVLGNIQFFGDLKPGGLPGSTGDVLISQGTGVAPKWVLPSSLGVTGPAGANGSNGANGLNGKNSLVKTTIEPAGVNCANGGKKVDSGIDTDNNGTLDVGEITTTDYICDGAAGAAGAIGATGPAGAVGATGPIGLTGATGAAGSNGTNGAIGATGPAGAVGATGPIGLTGATGSAGSNGTNGAAGAIGANGATGPAGAIGANGTNGAVGATGPAGADGALNAWALAGNAVTTANANFVGTTDNVSVRFRTNNTKKMIIDSLGRVGIGVTATPNPKAMLDIDAAGTLTKGGLLLPRLTTAERNSITAPIPESLLIYNTTTRCFEAWNQTTGVWDSFGCLCSPLSAPTALAGSGATGTTFVANWSLLGGATSYVVDVSTSNTFGSFVAGYNGLNVGNVSTLSVTGLTCGTAYYYRIKAINGCGTGVYSSTITMATSACPSITCGGQVFDLANLNVGTMILNAVPNQLNNGTVEKYCYNDVAANCTTFGGLYQWDEAMNYTTGINCDPCGAGGRQGICPAGSHIPTDLEWIRYEYCVESTIAPAGTATLSDFQTLTGFRGSNVGDKLKAVASAWDGTNSSGFGGLPAAVRSVGGNFSGIGSVAYYWAATEGSATFAWFRIHLSGNAQSYRGNDNKGYGFSVRCLLD